MHKKPKIAVIGFKGLPAYGGAGAIGELILNHLKTEFKFTVFSDSANTHLKTGYYNGYHQIVLKSINHQGLNFLLYFLKSAFHCLFKAKYDVIHVHHLAGAFVVPLLRLKYKNVIVTSHGMPDKTDKWSAISWLYYPLMRFLFARFSKIITTVTSLDQKHYKTYTNKEIIYIPNGIDQIPVKLPHEEFENDIFFAAGRIISTKGCHVLLEALIKNQFKGNLLIAGDLNQIESYKKKILELSKQVNTKFLGLIKDKPLLLGYIKKSKLFVFPSSVEAMSMMLLEVALTKTPIIASDIPENKVIFSDEEVLYFNTNDKDDLANKINYANSHMSIMQQKAELAFKKLMTNYNIKNIAPQYAKLYNQLLNN